MTENERFELDQLAEVTGGTYGIPPPFINGVDTSGGINSIPRPILSGFIHKYGRLQKIPKVVLNQLFELFKDGKRVEDLTEIQRQWLYAAMR